MSTRGAISWVSNTPTGLPLCTSSVSSSLRRRSVRTMASKLSQSRAALPAPPYTMSSIRILGDLRIEVVHQHAQRGLLLPAPAADLGAARRAYRPRSRRGLCVHDAASLRGWLSGRAVSRAFWLHPAPGAGTASSTRRRLSRSLDAISFPNTGMGRDAGIEMSRRRAVAENGHGTSCPRMYAGIGGRRADARTTIPSCDSPARVGAQRRVARSWAACPRLSRRVAALSTPGRDSRVALAGPRWAVLHRRR